ncbi:MAG: RNA methyltransferase [Coriobacteriales bacterium]|jgi:16S rRNA (uracil1498-N3)-methyltransferase|nr:RNA methyltransferase [Coriobacteriales bacterium]
MPFRDAGICKVSSTVTLPHFFVEKSLNPDDRGDFRLTLDRELWEHLRTARIRAGESIVLTDGRGTGLEVLVEKLHGMPEPLLTGRLLRTFLDRVGEQLTLVQGISKNDSMDQTVRQATELGILRLIPLESERSTIRLSAMKRAEKVRRWGRIARAASEQSARLTFPVIEEPVDLEGALRLLADQDGLIVCWEEAQTGSLGQIVREMAKRVFANPRIALFIGPEGGFSQSEIALMAEKGARLASLGEGILRTETAAVAASAIVLYHLGALGASERVE